MRGSLTLLAAWAAVPVLLNRLGLMRSARLLLHTVVGVCIASLLVAILLPSVGQHSSGDLVQGAHDGRWRGIFSHKNGLGPWAAYGTVLPVLYGGMGMCWPVRFIGSACAFACLIFSGSATSMALAVVCIALHFGLRALRRWPGVTLMAGAAALAVAGLASEPLFTALGRSASLSGRGAIWSFAWEYVVESSWVGHGYGTLGGADLRAREASLFGEAIPGPESGYLDLLLETGLVGCALFLAAYVACLVKGFAWIKRSPPAVRRAVEFYLTILISTLAEAATESTAFVVTGYSGVIFFAAFFALSTAPWPSGVVRPALRHEVSLGRKRDAKIKTRGAESEVIDDNTGR